MQSYEQLKSQIKRKRQEAILIPPEQVGALLAINKQGLTFREQLKALGSKLSELTLQLKTMSASPMEYEMWVLTCLFLLSLFDMQMSE